MFFCIGYSAQYFKKFMVFIEKKIYSAFTQLFEMHQIMYIN